MLSVFSDQLVVLEQLLTVYCFLVYQGSLLPGPRFAPLLMIPRSARLMVYWVSDLASHMNRDSLHPIC